MMGKATATTPPCRAVQSPSNLLIPGLATTLDQNLRRALHGALEGCEVAQQIVLRRVGGENAARLAHRHFDHQVFEKAEILDHPAVRIHPDAVLETVGS